ncbi:hypothetical protein RvY_09325 [Ramazzottius varieornatus]|uniref:SH3 domain-containing protein n=1 Tax=Ramazzottius varieornatus TaxID=947166 RepID=A0A1D1V920_RAMVA|nr:hypothetical protein RvY_09325 [Ramazzottius varieornatus]
MYNLLDNEVEQVSQLIALVEATVEFHKQNAAILENLQHTLYSKRDEAAMKVREPRQHRVPPTAYPSSSRATPEPTMFTNGNGSPEAADIADSDNAWGGPPAVTASPTRSPSPLSPTGGTGMYPSARQGLQMTADTQISFGSSLVPPPKGSVPAVSTPVSVNTPLSQPEAAFGNGHGLPHLPMPPSSHSQLQQPKASCKALYDFEPENEGELEFKENDLITLTDRIDENWFEGTVHGKSGVFPVTYVEVIVDLPKK